MIDIRYLKGACAAGVVALSLGAQTATAALASQVLSIVPQGQTSFFRGDGGGSVSVTFDVVISGLSSNTLVSAYDFGIIYDPGVMTLSSFSGFTQKLGSTATDSFESLVTDHLDNTNDSFNNPSTPAVNSVWDYRDDHPSQTPGTYTGDVLGTPDITNQYIINEGSLRFTEVSLLIESELNRLQDPANNDALTLFSLTFDVDTTDWAYTPIQVVDDRYYDGWDANQTGGVLDVKFNDGFTPQYLVLQGSGVYVPTPGTLLLFASAVLLLARRRTVAAKS